MGPKMPTDLDQEGKKKWRVLVECVDPDVDYELLANYCRTYSGMMAIRTEWARQLKSGTYQSLVPGRDGSQQLNPLQTAENRMVASLNRMLRTLGLAPSREEQGRRKPPQSGLPPPGMRGPEPQHGWVLEVALCRCLSGEAMSAEQAAIEGQWDEWLAARRIQGGNQ